MAKKLTPDRDDNQNIEPAELKKLMDAALEQQTKASEFNAEHGSIIRNALERWGLDKTAFTIFRRLYRMAEDRRHGALRDMLKLCAVAGFFDQRDAFEDTLEMLTGMLARGGAAAEPDAAPDGGDKPKKGRGLRVIT